MNYVQSSLDVLVNTKVEEKLKKLNEGKEEDNSNCAEKFETLLRKEEKEIREHIAVRLIIFIFFILIVGTSIKNTI